MADVDTVLELLSEERRRYALYYLEQRDEPVAVEELAEEVAAMEEESAPARIPDERFDRVELSLQHNHLPKADEAQFVEYDPEEEVVRLTGEPPEFEALITVAEVLERPS